MNVDGAGTASPRKASTWDDWTFCLNADGHVGGRGTPEMTTVSVLISPRLWET